MSKYRERYGADPDALASLAYDAAFVLFSAIEKAGSLVVVGFLDSEMLNVALKTEVLKTYKKRQKYVQK